MIDKKTCLLSGNFAFDIIKVREYHDGFAVGKKNKFEEKVVVESIGNTCGNVSCILSYLGVQTFPIGHFDLSDYADKLFGMFSGKEERVTLCFPNSLANAAVDYFGADAFLSPDDRPDRFRITAPVALSPRFYGWVLGFGGQVELLSPESAREELRRQAEEAGKVHQKV